MIQRKGNVSECSSKPKVNVQDVFRGGIKSNRNSSWWPRAAGHTEENYDGSFFCATERKTFRVAFENWENQDVSSVFTFFTLTHFRGEGEKAREKVKIDGKIDKLFSLFRTHLPDDFQLLCKLILFLRWLSTLNSDTFSHFARFQVFTANAFYFHFLSHAFTILL